MSSRSARLDTEPIAADDPSVEGPGSEPPAERGSETVESPGAWEPDPVDDVDRPPWALDDDTSPFVGAGVPAVVAVVPTRDPGPWFESALEGLADQDYANLAVLVVDAGSYSDPTPTVASKMPAAFVRRIDRGESFAEAANQALGSVEGAVFYLFLHDDVALGPDAVLAMVTEAFRSNAGVVGAKLVDWDDAERLRSVGGSIDKFGFLAPLSEPDELDQSQHDAVQDVFVVSTAAMLVRADLFDDLGGFSTDIDGFGEDLDLCWRARVAGARVIVMPGAVARHRERSDLAEPTPDVHRLALRHQARILLTCYSPLSLLRVGPQAALYSIIDAVLCLVTGRLRGAWDVVTAWMWNIVHLPTTLRLRGRVKRARRVPDSEVRAFQVHGSARLTVFLRGARSAGERRIPAALAAARGLPSSWQDSTGITGVVLAFVLAVVWLIGSRSLISDGVPAVRELSPFGSVSQLTRAWWSGWTPAGFGGSTPSVSSIPALWGANLVTFGSSGLIRTAAVLAMLPIGVAGAWRVLRGVGSRWARAATAVAYAVVATPYDSLAEGRLQALVLFASLPWIVGRLMRASGVEPFEFDHRSPWRQGIALSLVVFAAAALAPVTLVVTAAIAVVLALVIVVYGSWRGAGRVLATAGIGVLFASLALVPDLVALARGYDPIGDLFGARSAAPSGFGFDDLVRLTTGETRGGIVLAAVSVAGLLVLVVGRGWRLRWGAAGWAVALVAWAVIVLLGRSSIEALVPSMAVMLMPAALGVALAVGMGAQAIEIDVLGGQFGWRQLAAVVAAAALVVAVIPWAVAAADGRWGLPESDSPSMLTALDGRGIPQDRTLWLGDPDELPLRSRELVAGVGWTLTDGADPTLVTATAVGDGALDRRVEELLRATVAQGPGRLGAALAPLGIRYLIVLDGPAPGEGGSPSAAVEQVNAALGEQLDLDVVDLATGLQVYENDAAWPVRSTRPITAVDPLSAGRTPALGRGAPPVEYTGPIADGNVLDVAINRQSAWHVDVDDRAIPQEASPQGVQSYEVERGGAATLEFRSPWSHRLLLLVQVIVLSGLVATARRGRWRRRAEGSEVRS